MTEGSTGKACVGPGLWGSQWDSRANQGCCPPKRLRDTSLLSFSTYAAATPTEDLTFTLRALPLRPRHLLPTQLGPFLTDTCVFSIFLPGLGPLSLCIKFEAPAHRTCPGLLEQIAKES